MFKIFIIALSIFSFTANASQDEDFTDEPVGRDFEHPTWFKESFLNLQSDLSEAVANGKKGIAVYFGQKHCAYCKAFMERVLADPDVEDYFRRHFDVIALDIWGNRDLVLPDGDEMDERSYSVLEETNFTPSMLFYNAKGEVIFRMRGFNNAYRFRATLNYLVEDYYKKETFRAYLARADAPKFDEDALNEHEQFLKFNTILDRRLGKAQKPLAVLFEKKNCHACDQLHTLPLHDAENLKWLSAFEVHQFDGSSSTPIILPNGDKSSEKQWADQLNIHYYPSMLFFDSEGKEIMRIDSLVKLYRLRGVLEYVATQGYKKFANYQRWRRYTRDLIPQ